MTRRGVSIATGILLVTISGTPWADAAQMDQHRSFFDLPYKLLVASCMHAIGRSHDQSEKLVLNRKGRLQTGDDFRTFLIDGWLWRDGARAQAHHQCTARNDRNGLAIDVDYASAQGISRR